MKIFLFVVRNTQYVQPCLPAQGMLKEGLALKLWAKGSNVLSGDGQRFMKLRDAIIMKRALEMKPIGISTLGVTLYSN
jgi:hypothetical protein